MNPITYADVFDAALKGRSWVDASFPLFLSSMDCVEIEGETFVALSAIALRTSADIAPATADGRLRPYSILAENEKSPTPP